MIGLSMFRVGFPWLESSGEPIVDDMHITADREACVGAGQCALVAESLFDQDDDGLVLLLNAEPTGDEQALARRAATLCPARAITVSD